MARTSEVFALCALVGCGMALGGYLVAAANAGPAQGFSSSSGLTGVVENNSTVATFLSDSIPALWGSKEASSANLEAIAAQCDFINDLVAGSVLPSSVYDAMPRMVRSYVRNLIGVVAIYFGLGVAWSYYIYHCFGDWLFKPGEIPRMKDVLDQAKVACIAMPLYALLPVATEWAIEEGYTLVYAHVSDVGVAAFAGLFVLYMACVEYGVYWMHRGLHEVKIGYQLLHHTHHKYNKEHSMSPFAGLAFNALDGMMQAWPYCAALALVPMHFTTHLMLLFATGVWTCNIHDNIHGKVEPIMGAKYHTIHHTTYKHNYGHYFIFMDWLHGTLETPEEHYARLGQSKQAQ